MSTHKPELFLPFLEKVSNYTKSFFILSLVLVELPGNSTKHVPTGFSLVSTCHCEHPYYQLELRFITTYLTLPFLRV
jgi:hypothetical protein